MDAKLTSAIFYDPEENVVVLPYAAYAQLHQFCRTHGETDLPMFLEFTDNVPPADDLIDETPFEALATLRATAPETSSDETDNFSFPVLDKH